LHGARSDCQGGSGGDDGLRSIANKATVKIAWDAIRTMSVSVERVHKAKAIEHALAGVRCSHVQGWGITR
jgi:hypothetical protein